MTAVRRSAVVLLCALAAALVLVPAAAAQQDPFGPIPQPAPEPLPPPPAPAEDDGLNTTQSLLIGGAGLVLLLGIAWAILRDAKQAAPADRPGPTGLAALDVQDRPKGSRPTRQQRVKTNRAKAKVARQSRKRNR